MPGLQLATRLLFWLLVGALAGFAIVQLLDLLDSRARQIIRSQATARAMDHVRLGVLPYVSTDDFAVPHSETKLADIRNRLDPLLMRLTPDEAGLMGVDLIADDGVIIYSDEPVQIGRPTSHRGRAALDLALSGGIGSVTARRYLEAAEAPDAEQALDVYVPVIMNGVVVGAYEMDLRPPLVSTGSSWTWMSLGCAGGAVCFALDHVRRVPRRRTTRAAAALGTAAVRTISLTPREREVLQLLAAGRSYRGIASELVVSEETVRSHVKRILRKTGQANSTAAVTVALRAGLIELPGDGPAAATAAPASPAQQPLAS